MRNSDGAKRARRRLWVVRSAYAAAAAFAILITAAVSAPASLAHTPRSGGTVTTRGFDYSTFATARLISGVGDNNVDLTYTANGALDNATLRVALPRSQWPTGLFAGYVVHWSASVAHGLVEIRPWPDHPDVFDPTSPCTWSDTAIESLADRQIIDVHGVTCAAGQQLRILMLGLRASSAGRFQLPVAVTGADGPQQHSAPTVRVVPPPPPARLRISIPKNTTIGTYVSPTEFVVPTWTQIPVRITAVRPDGSVATDFRDAVALTNGEDCGLIPGDNTVAHQFTAAERGSAVEQESVATANYVLHGATGHLRAWDVSHGARPSAAKPFTVSSPIPRSPSITVVPPDQITCPVSYH